MALDPVKNFAKATVSTGYNASDTSIVLSSGHGAKFPQPSTDGAFNVTWWNSTDYPDPSDDPNVEIVRVTARSTDTLTVTRAQENTSGSTKNTVGKTYKMILGPTAKVITDVASSVQKIVSQTAHGFVAGDVIKSSGTANQYAKAQADSAANAEVVGIVTSVPDADNFVFTTGGEITSGVPAVAAGTTLFLSPTVAGGLTSTEPTTNGQVSKPVATVIQNATRMLMFNMRGMEITAASSGGWQQLAETTTGSALSTITLSSIPTRKDLRVVIAIPSTGGVVGMRLTFNNDSGSNYSARRSTNNGAQSTQTSQAVMSLLEATASLSPAYFVMDIMNQSTENKLVTGKGFLCTGAANAGTEYSFQGCWGNTANQINRIDLDDGTTNTFGTGTRITVYGKGD